MRNAKFKARGEIVRHMADTWAVVLAGGDGSRLSKLTTNPDGLVIPKQYCSLERSSCLLQDALSRASTVALPSHICTVVAAQHRQWWTFAAAGLNQSNVFVQPRNKGTGFGILLALLTLEMRNPGATLVLLPADHYFREEEPITRVLRIAANIASEDTGSTFLLGAEPDHFDAELGYILPTDKVTGKPAFITGFKEKPSPEHAQELMGLGALWNLFILVGSVSGLLGLFAEDHSNVVARMREAVRQHAAGRRDALDVFYESIELIDFSADILEVQANRLQVIRVPHCGWTDLGTPERVEATIRSMMAQGAGRRQARVTPLFFDLGVHFRDLSTVASV